MIDDFNEPIQTHITFTSTSWVDVTTGAFGGQRNATLRNYGSGFFSLAYCILNRNTMTTGGLFNGIAGIRLSYVSATPQDLSSADHIGIAFRRVNVHPYFSTFGLRVYDNGAYHILNLTTDMNNWITSVLQDLQAGNQQIFEVPYSSLETSMSNVDRIDFLMITSVPNSNFSLDYINAIPEPSSIILMIFSFIFSLLIRSKKDKIKETN